MGKSFPFTILCYREDKVVAAYEPVPAAPFVAHRDLARKGEWAVTHRGSTFLAGAGFRSLTGALKFAAGAAAACPSAGRVKSKRDGLGVKLTGPHRKLRNEVNAYRDFEGMV